MSNTLFDLFLLINFPRTTSSDMVKTRRSGRKDKISVPIEAMVMRVSEAKSTAPLYFWVDKESSPQCSN